MLATQQVTSLQLSMFDVETIYVSDDSIVVSEFTHSSTITSVEKLTPDNVWVSYYTCQSAGCNHTEVRVG